MPHETRWHCDRCGKRFTAFVEVKEAPVHKCSNGKRNVPMERDEEKK